MNDSRERTPLLSEQRASASDLQPPRSQNEIVINPIETFPSHHAISNNDITCNVCQESIDISDKRDKTVLDCTKCNESTPIRPPPQGRKFIRCSCFKLLMCSENKEKIRCPKCKIVNRLYQPISSPNPELAAPNYPGLVQVTCGHCSDRFPCNPVIQSLITCPHCRKKSSVGETFARKRCLIYFCLTVIVTLLLITVACTTSSSAGWYFVDALLVLITLFLLLRTFFFWTVKISFVLRDDNSI